MEGSIVARILLVEDDETLALSIRDNLQLEGHGVSWVDSGPKALVLADEENFDLIVLDVMLPEIDGYDVLKKIRITKQTPVLMISAKGRIQDRIKGLELEADDYLPKPFHLKEFLLRVQSLLRRAQQSAPEPETLTIGSAQINLGLMRVDFGKGESETLSPREAKMLRLLIKNSHRVTSRDEMLSVAWSDNENPSPRTVDNFIVKLRKWIEEDPSTPRYVLSHRGVGYSLRQDQK